jgi:hypothetical protein
MKLDRHLVETALGRIGAWTGAPTLSVAALLPSDCSIYVRVLHPALTVQGEQIIFVAWDTVARRTGATLHAEAQFACVAKGAPEYFPPTEGNLPEEMLQQLASALLPSSSTPTACICCTWNGWAEVQGEQTVDDLTVAVPWRGYRVRYGDIRDPALCRWGGQAYRAPNVWWPADEKWWVATEVDLNSTYVGGSDPDLVDRLRDAGLEVVECNLETRVDLASDWMNCPETVRE